MALKYTDTSGTLIKPGAAAKWQVSQSASGTSTTGVLVLIGEAAEGPYYGSTGEDVTASYFGPTQKAAVVRKYGSGRLVDAFCQAVAPSKDAAVNGSPSRVYLIKTNQGTKATGTLGAYATLTALKEGANGNLINLKVVSATGGKVTVTAARSMDSVSESWTIGNTPVLNVCAVTANAVNLVVGATTITSTGDLPTVAALNITKSQFATLRDLATFIASQTGWTCAAVPAFAQKSPSILDQETVDVHSAGGTPTGWTHDADEFVTALNSSTLVSVTGTAPVTGLPSVTSSLVYLTTGAKGTSTDAGFTAALLAAEQIDANFIVPLVSQDASTTGEDTESGSTYTVAGVNAALATHVAKMSQFKYRKPRQGFPSFRGTYANSKLAAQNMAYARCTMSFMDVIAGGVSGTAWFQPWMGAVEEAAMQAACGYRPTFGKTLNILGARSNAGDFQPSDVDQVEDALLAGLTIIGPRRGGGLEFVSDQTTYSVDDNFVLNSVQAIYGADVVSVTTADRMENAFKGQSFADVSAGVAMSYFKSIMAELRRLKWIVGDDEAPAGFKNAVIEINAPTMLVSAEIKLATGIYFIPISFTLTQVRSTATA